MASPLKTPGVYRQEISLFPPSIAAVETAVPAFVGYTERASDRSGDLRFKAVKIDSIAEFRERFGEGPEVKVDAVHLNLDDSVAKVRLQSGYFLYDSMRLFYENGGGQCYVVSVGSFDEAVSADALKKGLKAVALEDQPTLLVMPDGIALDSAVFYSVQVAALEQCGELKDRFAILDLLETKNGQEFGLDESVEEFRTEIGMNSLKYGAAYVPHLRARLPKRVTYRSVQGKLKRQGVQLADATLVPDAAKPAFDGVTNAIKDVDSIAGAVESFVKDNRVDPEMKAVAEVFKAAYDEFQSKAGKLLAGNPTALQLTATIQTFEKLFDLTYKLIQKTVDKHAVADATNELKLVDQRKFARDQIANILKERVGLLNAMTVDGDKKVGWAQANNRLYKKSKGVAVEWGGIYDDNHNFTDNLASIYPRDTTNLADDNLRRANGENMVSAAKEVVSIFHSVRDSANAILATAKEAEVKANNGLLDAAPLLRNVINAVADAESTVPPSGVIAGVYCKVDASRGVHKSPANVSLNSISDVTTIISHKDQEALNVDSLSGKSINAIRSFLGRGKLVWGARTLDGNSNEWRYISVRRFFNMVEESTKNASERFVFESNDRNTWVKARGMIENFLLVQWRNGALQGAVPEDAFFVKVGLGETMTPLDILEGRMIVEIGMAVVRPAEFIVLRFSHKMPVS